jgi:hypothetical protein
MTAIQWDLAVAVGTQSGLGSINTTIRDLTGSIASSDGIVLGDAGSGEGESGVSLALSRELTEKAKLGNFTLQASNFIKEAVDSLAISWGMKGNGATITAPIVDSEYTPLAGIDALLQGLSLTGSGWGSGDGWSYVPAPLTYLTVKLWVGKRTSDSKALAWVFQDVVATGKMVWTPKLVGVATAELTPGSVAQFAEETYPTLDYTTQASVSAPAVQSAAHAWGASRGFQSFELEIGNEVEQLDDSNAATGETPRITDRNITASVKLWSDDTDLDFERAELVDTVAPADAMTFRVGTAAGDTDTASGYQVKLLAPEARALKPIRIGDTLGWELELAATAAAANGEFELIFD